jgi:hypothetical protein
MKRPPRQVLWIAIAIALTTWACDRNSGTTSAPTMLPPVVQQQPPLIHLALIDETGANSRFDSSVLPAWARAFQDQINNDARPAWGGPRVTVAAYHAMQDVPKGSWVVHLLATRPDFACAGTVNAAGCHNMGSDGLPYAEVNVSLGGSVYVSHEILEMWHNPTIRACAHRMPVYGEGEEEIVDPFASLYYIGTGNIPVEDFARPAWFGIGKGPPYDFKNTVNIDAAGPGLIPRNTDARHKPLGFFNPGC